MIELNNGVMMPEMGYGVFQITDEKVCFDSTLAAIEAGYRLIDTAACYGNERAVGDAVRAGGIDRKEIFLVSKVWVQDAGYDKTLASFEKTLENLGTDYLDLYLIHMPLGDYHGSYEAMEELYREGRVKAIGVCNFMPDRLLDLVLSHNIVPQVNQIELHPFCQQDRTRKLMEEYGIKTMAWAPFAEGRNGIFTDPVLSEIGRKYNKTPAQVVIRWLISEGIIPIPKSVHRERIEENRNVGDFWLSDGDIAAIRRMDKAEPLILDIASPEEVCRLHNIRFVQR